MTTYQMSISFSTDRELTDREVTDLLHSCIVQIEEPQAESDDPALIGSIDADFTTKITAGKVEAIR